jgi:uncharacterized protein
MRFMNKAVLVTLLALSSLPAYAGFLTEDADETGVLNPNDNSWRAYISLLDRFPDRLGLTCDAAYLLDKGGDHEQAIRLFKECSKRGNAPSMVYLSYFYEGGRGVPVDMVEATRWMKKAAETGYGLAEYHYGMALLQGLGVERNDTEGRAWIVKAAEQKDKDAIALVRSGFSANQLASFQPEKCMPVEGRQHW